MSTRIEELARLWSVRLPRLLDPWVPELADSFADNAWMMPWWNAVTIAPFAALSVGFLAPWLWPGMNNIYSESLLFLLLATASALLNWSFGASLFLGYVAGDLLHLTVGHGSFSMLAGHGVGYLLLGILVIRIPQLARELTEGARWLPPEPTLRRPLQAALYVGASAGLVFLWCQGTIVLIRPVFTWAGGDPTDEAVVQVQRHWPWLVLFALGAAAARVVLEDVHREPSGLGALAAKLEGERWVGDVRRAVLWRSLPLPVRIGLGALLLTVILAGTYAGWIDALIVLVVTGAVGAWRTGELGKVPQGWANAVEKLPVALRIAFAALGGYSVSRVLLTLFWSTGSLRPVMLGALLTLVLSYALSPRSVEEEGI